MLTQVRLVAALLPEDRADALSRASRNSWLFSEKLTALNLEFQAKWGKLMERASKPTIDTSRG